MSDIGKILGYASDDDGTFKASPPAVTVPREQAERTLRVQLAVEWDGWRYSVRCCPSCGQGRMLGHASDCELAASIADWRAVLG